MPCAGKPETMLVDDQKAGPCGGPDDLGGMWRFSTIKARPGNMNSVSVH
jgi:hypothetical protein